MINKTKKHFYSVAIIVAILSSIISFTPIGDKALPAGQATEAQAATMGESNSLSRAKSYLETMSFSKKGLIKQLKFEGYTAKEAKYGASKCGANWKNQAAAKAKSYLDTMPFSKKGLIKQLKFDGFTDSEAKYGVSKCGANWKEQAAKKAKSYLDTMSFSRQGLINQLKFDGFTDKEAKYGVKKSY